eukprot:7088764-Pyramimonas_sp.AAC.1
MLTAGVSAALFSKKLSKYNRMRWTGPDISTDEQGIFEACHGLLSRTYVRYARECGDKIPSVFDDRRGLFRSLVDGGAPG